MLLWATFDQNSVIVRVKILDSTATTGAGKTGLTSASAGLIISTIADSEATATAYTVTGSTIETITTLGTYAAPTATKCRFKEVDATNHPGVYECQFADARFSIAGAKSLLISILGATGAAQCDAVIALPVIDLFASVLPANVTQLLGTAWLTPGTAGTPDVNAKQLGAAPVTATTSVTIPAAATLATTTGAVGSVTGAVGSVTGAVGSVTAGVTLAASAVQAIWDALTSALTTVGSIGKRLADFITGDAFVRLGAPSGASTSADIAAVKVDTAAILVDTGTSGVVLSSGIKKNTALTKFEFLMTDSTTHAPVTGKTVTVTRSIDNGAFAAGTLSAVTEIAFGVYSVDFGAADLNGTVITLRATAATSDDLIVTIVPDP